MRGIYELKSSKAKSFPFTDLLTHLNLAVTEDNRLEIAYEAFYVIESDVAKLLKPKRRKRERSGDTSLSVCIRCLDCKDSAPWNRS